jgi:endoplasmic reticulum-Golgi intermediate compartment protein 3
VRFCQANPGTGLFQYFLKVVPTQYSNRRLSTATTTNQYTVTEKFRPVVMGDFAAGGMLQVFPLLSLSSRSSLSVSQAGVIPGIFFVYELSPFLISVTEEQVPLSHLITRLLAIVGGVFSVMGIIDALLFRLNKLASKNS